MAHINGRLGTSGLLAGTCICKACPPRAGGLQGLSSKIVSDKRLSPNSEGWPMSKVAWGFGILGDQDKIFTYHFLEMAGPDKRFNTLNAGHCTFKRRLSTLSLCY